MSLINLTIIYDKPPCRLSLANKKALAPPCFLQ